VKHQILADPSRAPSRSAGGERAGWGPLAQLDHFRPRFGFLWAGALKQINHLNRARG